MSGIVDGINSLYVFLAAAVSWKPVSRFIIMSWYFFTIVLLSSLFTVGTDYYGFLTLFSSSLFLLSTARDPRHKHSVSSQPVHSHISHFLLHFVRPAGTSGRFLSADSQHLCVSHSCHDDFHLSECFHRLQYFTYTHYLQLLRGLYRSHLGLSINWGNNSYLNLHLHLFPAH